MRNTLTAKVKQDPEKDRLDHPLPLQSVYIMVMVNSGLVCRTPKHQTANQVIVFWKFEKDNPYSSKKKGKKRDIFFKEGGIYDAGRGILA